MAASKVVHWTKTGEKRRDYACSAANLPDGGMQPISECGSINGIYLQDEIGTYQIPDGERQCYAPLCNKGGQTSSLADDVESYCAAAPVQLKIRSASEFMPELGTTIRANYMLDEKSAACGMPSSRSVETMAKD